MTKIHYTFALLLALCLAPAGAAGIRVGVDIDEYPHMVLVPGYPVYYAPEVSANYFFYDGDFWMYRNDSWYRSPWYDGPWEPVPPEGVPDALLQIPVRYYLQPPVYFFTWWYDDPPHWGEHWGDDWERRRHGWNRRDYRQHDQPAPLPDYQRQYSGDRYPVLIEQQRKLQHEHYRYRAHDPLVLQHRQTRSVQSAPAQQNRDRVPEAAGLVQHTIQRSNLSPGNPEVQRIPQRESIKEQGAAAASEEPQHSETQSRTQARPETIHREENVHDSESAETRRSERDVEQEQTRALEKERSRER